MNRVLDLVERSLWTFAQAFSAAVVVTGKLDLLSLKIAAVAAVIAVLKGVSMTATAEAGKVLAAPAATPRRRTTS